MAGSVNVTNVVIFQKTKKGKLVDPVWPDCNSANYLCGNFSSFHFRKRMIKAFLGIKWIKTKIDMFPQIQKAQGQLIAVAVLLTKPSESLRVGRVTLSDIHRPQLSLMQLFKNKTRLQNAKLCLNICCIFTLRKYVNMSCPYLLMK